MTTKNKLFWGLSLLASMGISSCGDKDLYDPNYKVEQYNQAWAEKFGTVDANQDWVMAKQVTANLTADEDGTFYLYNGNPINKDGNALLLATCEAKAGQTTTISFDAPENLSTIYVAHFQNGYLRAVPATVEDNKISADLNPQETRIDKMSDAFGGLSNAYEKAKEEMNWTPDENVLKLTASDGTEVKAGIYQYNNSNVYYIIGSADSYTFPAESQIYVQKGATFNAGVFTLDNSKIYNAGTIEATSITATAGSIVFNGLDATMNVSGALTLDNSDLQEDVQFWNEGTLQAGSYVQGNGGNSVNAPTGVVAISGDTKIESYKDGSVDKNGNSNRQTSNWTNMYKWTTYNMELTAGSDHLGEGTDETKLGVNGSGWVNCCCLTVNGTMTIAPNNYHHFTDDKGQTLDYTYSDHSALINDGGALVKVKDIVLDHAGISMGGNSLFKITGTATFKVHDLHSNANKETNECFNGAGDNYAVLQIHKAVAETDDNGKTIGNAIFSGRLYVACDDLFTDQDGAYSFDEGSNWGETTSTKAIYCTGETNAPINIPVSECNPEGYRSYTLEKAPDNAQPFIFACEDLGSTGDFDFNDVVFSVSHVANSTEATITPLAAGGTLAATIYYGDKEIGEIHSMLDESSTSTMINTKSITNEGKSLPISVDANWSILTNYNQFKIKVQSGTESMFVTAPTKGNAPMMIIVPNSWQWPIETTSIIDAYPDFQNWAADEGYWSWLNNCNSDKTVTRQ